ncbi:MAG: MarR family winged helix-turn-helix transcriptional regulator [Pseudomonadota bacterium]
MSKKPETTSASSQQGGRAKRRVEFYKASNYKTDESVGYLMRRILTLIAQGVERRLEPTGLTNAQWMPMLKLQMGTASTVAELARGCQLDAGSMTRLLDRLEAKQLCRRSRSSEDRRVVNLELTETGRAAAQEIPAALSHVQNVCLEGFTEDEWLQLRGFLVRILDNAQAHQEANLKNES